MATQSLKPQTIRTALLLLLVSIVIAGLGLFYLSLTEVRRFAVEVNHTIADAKASEGQVNALQQLKGQLVQSDALITKANQMFATPLNYQNQAITDTNNYAKASGIAVAKIDFQEAIAGVDPTMTVSLKAPVAYSKLIQFLHGIEGNMPKMQVTHINIAHLNTGTADSVTVKDIKIKIATR